MLAIRREFEVDLQAAKTRSSVSAKLLRGAWRVRRTELGAP
jgi:hypothetical protein